MKVDTIQTSFTAGELAPTLFGRTDIAQYKNACETVENFLVRPYGPVISTPGTEYINECKTGGSTSISRLIPFVFSRTDAYVIEMGVQYFRFYTNRAVVVSNSTTYEVAHPYDATEIRDVQISQVNDVIYMAHPDHAPRRLTRIASNNWTVDELPFVGGPFLSDNVIYSNSTTSILSSATITPSATTGSITLSCTSNVFIPSGSTLGHKNTYWKIGGTALTSSTTGLPEQGYVQITAVTNPSTATATVIKTLDTSAATTQWAQGAWSDVVGWPARVALHQQRLFFARTTFKPQNVWGSKVFEFENFALDGGNDDDALNLELVSKESNDIKWLHPGSALIAGTYGGEFVIRSGDDSPLTPSNVNVSQETSWGSEPIPPRKIGNYLYYIQRFGLKLRELFYNFDLDSWKSVDKMILAPHISNDGFVEMAYQQDPDTILWCLTTNGTIATLTREVDQEVQGWARQTTDGEYESITSIPSQTTSDDEVWVIVKRSINGSDVRYVEAFKSQIVPDRQDQCWYVHSGLSYDAFSITASSSSTISLSDTSGTITITASTAHFSSGDVGQRIRAIGSSGTVVIGEMEITGFTSSTVVVGTVKYAFDATSYAAGDWGLSVNTISGLSHLETKSVVVLADGGTDKPNKTVTSGAITLGNDAFVVVVGLPYTQKLKTMAQEAGSDRGTSQGKIQRINEVAFKVNRSHKGFYVGGTEDEYDVISYIESTSTEVIYTGTIPNSNFVLERVSFRDPLTPMGTPEVLFTGIIPNVTFRDGYQYGSQITLQNQDPLPLELLSIITSVDTEDK